MKRLTVISLGGGVQSSVMALMASEGAFDTTPDCAIFADTHWEPPSVYDHIEWLEGQLRFPLYVVDNGRSLREDVKTLTNHSDSRSYVDIPVYLKGRDGEGDGIGRRQCTDNYKIRPVRRRIRDLLGLRPRQRRPLGDDCRAVAGHLHRRGHPHEDLPRQVDNEPLPAHRGGHVQAGLRRLVVGPLRQAPGTVGLRRLPLPVPRKVGRDQAPVAGAVRRGRFRLTPACAGDWRWTRLPTCTHGGCPWPRPSRSTRLTWETTGRRTASATSARGTAASDGRRPT